MTRTLKGLVAASIYALASVTFAHAQANMPMYNASGEVSYTQSGPAVQHRGRAAYSRGSIVGDVSIIGERSSTCWNAPTVRYLSCGCDTAIYFGVRNNVYPNGGHDLDLAGNWGRLQQNAGPCVGCAAWSWGHVFAIIGGGPGAWHVRDFNSGKGKTRDYVLASFPARYRFAHPADLHLQHQRVANRRVKATSEEVSARSVH